MVQHFIQQVTRWDEQLFGRVFGDIHHKTFKRFFYVLSRSVDSYSCTLMGVVWALAAPDSFPYYLFAGLCGFAIELTLYYFLKKSIRRPRPFRSLRGVQFLIVPPDEFSFPSGHTAAAFLLAFLIATAFPTLMVPVFIWASLVGFSRIYLGIHYPTDVLAGMVLGISSAQCGLWLLRFIQ